MLDADSPIDISPGPRGMGIYPERKKTARGGWRPVVVSTELKLDPVRDLRRNLNAGNAGVDVGMGISERRLRKRYLG